MSEDEVCLKDQIGNISRGGFENRNRLKKLSASIRKYGDVF
jgi:hypothetical protein